MKQIPLTIKKSLYSAFSIVAGLSTIAGIWGYTIKDIINNLQWWQYGIILLSGFLILSFGIFLIN